MVKYATALRLGTAGSESILRRFTCRGPKHPTYQVLEELGPAVGMIFARDYLGAPEPRREIHGGPRTVGASTARPTCELARRSYDLSSRAIRVFNRPRI